MSPSSEQIVACAMSAAIRELTQAAERVHHCIHQLDDNQIWWRPHDEMNSIGNLLLHLRGNLRQWIVAAIGGHPDDRERPSEFSCRQPLPAAQLLDNLQQTVDQAVQILRSSTASDLIRERVVQGHALDGLAVIFDSIAHFRGHTQEIIHMTRFQLGNEYQFAWRPTTVAEGAPADRHHS